MNNNSRDKIIPKPPMPFKASSTLNKKPSAKPI
jgi:hypothetical protein